MAEPTPFTSRLIQQAMQPAVRVPFAPAAQPTATAAPAQPTQAQRFRTAYLNALANPDMPIEPQFSTGSEKLDAQATARARAARMLAAGQSAVAERAAAQGRLVGTNPQTGAPVIGEAPASPIVRESPGGVRVAYRNGMPVGFSTPQPTMPFVGEAQQIIPTATRLAAEQSVARDRAMQVLRAAGATAPVAAAPAVAQAAPVAAGAASPVMAVPTPFPSAPYRDTSGRVDTAAVAMAQGRRPAPQTLRYIDPKFVQQERTDEEYVQEGKRLVALMDQAKAAGNEAEAAAIDAEYNLLVPGNRYRLRSSNAQTAAPATGELTPEEQLAEAEAVIAERAAQARQEVANAPMAEAERRAAAQEREIKAMQQRLATAQTSGNTAEVSRLSRLLRALLQGRINVQQEAQKIQQAAAEPMWIGP